MDVTLEMRQNYLKRRRDEYAKCLIEIENKKITFLETIGHQMKGNAQPFGFDELATIGNELEKAAKVSDWQSIKACVEKFGIYLSKQELF
jgi:HPt (histidine-containing phosphotransfer) domain-containing protein